jgi:hypothetical protein
VRGRNLSLFRSYVKANVPVPFTYWSSVLVSCLLLSQNVWHKHLKGGKIYFGSWFQRLQFIVSYLFWFWVGVRKKIRAEGYGEAKLLTIWWWPQAEQSKRLSSLFPLFASVAPACGIRSTLKVDPPLSQSSQNAPKDTYRSVFY